MSYYFELWRPCPRKTPYYEESRGKLIKMIQAPWLDTTLQFEFLKQIFVQSNGQVKWETRSIKRRDGQASSLRERENNWHPRN